MLLADCLTKPASSHCDSCSDPFTGPGQDCSGLVHLLAQIMTAVAWVIFIVAVAWTIYWPGSYS